MAAAYADSVHPPAASYIQDQGFFFKLSAWLSIFILFAFVQFALLGRADPFGAPVWVHLHAIAMVGWLGVLVAQNALARGSNLALHRKLGWAAAALVVAIVFLACYTGVKAVELQRQPPFFTPAYFLALTWIEGITFGAVVAAGIALRRQTQWHRRLLIGATIIILEPAFGRLIPAPLIGATLAESVAMILQLGVIGLIAAHDRKLLGRVHPATLWAGGAVVFTHIAVEGLSRLPALQALATSLAHA